MSDSSDDMEVYSGFVDEDEYDTTCPECDTDYDSKNCGVTCPACGHQCCLQDFV